MAENKNTAAQSIFDCVPTELSHIVVCRPSRTPRQSISERGAINQKAAWARGGERTADKLRAAFSADQPARIAAQSGTFMFPSSCHVYSSSSFATHSVSPILFVRSKTASR